MTTRYCGIGGDDGNSGLTWALRKLTLNGLEDSPVVAGDVCWVAPGVYREQLTVDVSGAGGNVITYCADVTGEHTDGVGGIVRITGSDNDQTPTRNNCIWGDGRSYRTFRGFSFDVGNSHLVNSGNASNWIVEDCSFQNYKASSSNIYFSASDQEYMTIRRCVFICSKLNHIYFMAPVAKDATNNLIENCIFLASTSDAIGLYTVGDVTIKNCLFLGSADDLIDVIASQGAGHPVLVYNCILSGADSNALEAATSGDIVEDYNTFHCNNADRSNVAIGANSVTYPALFQPPLLLDGFRLPWTFGALSEWSQVRALTGSSEPTTDLFGVARPATAAKNSWGPVQFHDVERETTTTQGSSVASIKLTDAARHQIFVPVSAESTTITVYCYREADYAGTLPQMLIKQPGQSDRTTVDTGNAATWNQLSDTFTPGADTDFVVVELVSNNTAVAGSFACFFDTLEVS